MSIVIPVYRGERTLPTVIDELLPYTDAFRTPGGHLAKVEEVILSYDRGPDRSDDVIRDLAHRHSFVKAVWLSRNFGQHAATLAGISSSGGDWIVTIDEDGQQDPAYISSMLDTAITEGAEVVYAKPTNKPPHGAIRNAASRTAKRILQSVFGSGNASDFNSFRLILGEIGRSVAAYTGTGVYLDVALTWVTNRQVTSPVQLREEGDRPSGYSYMRLLGHFWRMVLSTGTRGLRLVTIVGALFAAAGVLFAIYLVITRFASGDIPEGWTSQMVLTSLGVGAILVSLGIVAEYIGIAVNMAMGKPPYLIVRDPALSPLSAGKSNTKTDAAD
ncbi:glycosyltransferase [Microbacterium sp. CFH 90308]|uniref:Glycosyltransferase n=1 Tax=Microbacterium salsuginis TaxID=2722803 RepID=A0ABX1KD65_9MICO|nr:glycosyltransferase [Microbacterium sp. CFH 90308]